MIDWKGNLVSAIFYQGFNCTGIKKNKIEILIDFLLSMPEKNYTITFC